MRMTMISGTLRAFACHQVDRMRKLEHVQIETPTGIQHFRQISLPKSVPTPTTGTPVQWLATPLLTGPVRQHVVFASRDMGTWRNRTDDSVTALLILHRLFVLSVLSTVAIALFTATRIWPTPNVILFASLGTFAVSLWTWRAARVPGSKDIEHALATLREPPQPQHGVP